MGEGVFIALDTKRSSENTFSDDLFVSAVLIGRFGSNHKIHRRALQTLVHVRRRGFDRTPYRFGRYADDGD